MSDIKKYTLITGASSGIGYEIAKLFAKDGHNLLLIGRNSEKLQLVKDELNKFNVDIKILSLDLSNKDHIKNLFNYIEINKLDIENVINNAGVGIFGDYKDIATEANESLIDINITALTKITTYFLPKLIDKNSGGILNVASTAAFCAGPRMSTYYASKAYVLNLSESIHEECKSTKVKISCLCPGPVKTDFQSKAGIVKSESAKKYLMDAKTVAEEGYKGFKKGKVIIIPGKKNKLLVIANKFLPRSISRKVVLKTNK